jgi:hypothetical protein
MKFFLFPIKQPSVTTVTGLNTLMACCLPE